jgi:RHH-type proline utilization regulon transcriptional repressor/proline dehydrogenase/delta 1-pyrroline-5-carboxylate dehydrogenase
MAHRFIAGETPADAVPALKSLAAHGVGYTVDLLGEATLSEAEASAYHQRYLDLLRTLARDCPGPSDGIWTETPPVNVSVKLSALTPHYESAAPQSVARAVEARLTPLLLEARQFGAFVNIDMEQFVLRDLTLDVFEGAVMKPELRDYPHLGIVVQAYLRSAEASIHRLRGIAERRGAPITVRLVKGAYWEEEGITAAQNGWPLPVFDAKAATDASYERCTDLLLSSWPHLRPAFGTHNPRSVAQAIVKSRAAGLGQETEFQMLFGMAETLREAVREQGFRTRVYVPVGAIIPGMAYLVRRLLENTSNQSWFVTNSMDASEDEMVSPPAVSESPSKARDVDGFRNLPFARFHNAAEREAMASALSEVRHRAGGVQPLLIGTARRSDRELADVRCPAEPSVVLGRVAQATETDVEESIRLTRRGFEAWRDVDVDTRAAILRRAASLLEQKRFELAALMVYESAKPWREADGDVVEACDYLRFYADEAERLMAPEKLGDVSGEENTLLREPRGIAAVIAPWNFPLAILTGMTAAALATGNGAILKPAEQSPLIAARLVEVLREAGVPEDVVQYLPGAGESVGRALVEHPDVDVIAFTGSKEVGLSILQSAATVRKGQRQPKRVIAEMGGKNAIIVDEDADLDQAIAGVIRSAFGFAGQKCSACSRLIVVGNAYDDVLSRLSAAVESLVVGPPEDPFTNVPPVISSEAQQRINGYIEEGMRTARLLAQAEAPASEGYYVRPTVFVGVDPADGLATDEIFGPVLSVFHVASINEAVSLALDSEFALTGGLYSRNPRNIDYARRAFRVGNLYLNREITGAMVGRQPFGGLKMSGIGDKAGGRDYLLQFLSPRVVTENTVRRGFAPE